MSLPLGIFSDRPLRLRIDRFPDQICQWEYIWSYFHIAEFIGTGGGDIQSPGHQTLGLFTDLQALMRADLAINFYNESAEAIDDAMRKKV